MHRITALGPDPIELSAGSMLVPVTRHHKAPPAMAISHYCWCWNDTMAMPSLCSLDRGPQVGKLRIQWLPMLLAFPAGLFRSRVGPGETLTTDPHLHIGPCATGAETSRLLAHLVLFTKGKGDKCPLPLWSLLQLPDYCGIQW